MALAELWAGNTEQSLRLLVADDQEVIRQLCAEIAGSMRFRVGMASDGAEALRTLEEEPVDILLADLKMPGLDGMELLERVKSLSPQTEVVIITAYGSVPSAVQAMKLGAYDYLIKPFHTEELKLLLERIAQRLELASENRLFREQAGDSRGYGNLIGTSPAMRKIFRLIVKASQGHYPVLIQGESGTGKELVARAIQQTGPRAEEPFLPVDCSALVPTLIESELFGYVRGAFTGAVRAKEGLLEAAHGGTVFLDEIAELPLALQAKLLRTLQEKEIRPVGSTQRVKFDARIIAATNRDLEAAVHEGSFRKDLYFRLNVVTLQLPPLRERQNDIPLLVNHFLEKFRQPGHPRPTLPEKAMARLVAYQWPGNVRELENCIERALALASGPVINISDFSTSLQSSGHSPGGPSSTMAAPVIPLRELERRAILEAVSVSRGSRLLAAQLLGIGKTTLYRKLKGYR